MSPEPNEKCVLIWFALSKIQVYIIIIIIFSKKKVTVNDDLYSEFRGVWLDTKLL